MIKLEDKFEFQLGKMEGVDMSIARKAFRKWIGLGCFHAYIKRCQIENGERVAKASTVDNLKLVWILCALINVVSSISCIWELNLGAKLSLSIKIAQNFCLAHFTYKLAWIVVETVCRFTSFW